MVYKNKNIIFLKQMTYVIALTQIAAHFHKWILYLSTLLVARTKVHVQQL